MRFFWGCNLMRRLWVQSSVPQRQKMYRRFTTTTTWPLTNTLLASLNWRIEQITFAELQVPQKVYKVSILWGRVLTEPCDLFYFFTVRILWQSKTSSGWHGWQGTADQRQDPRIMTRRNKGPIQRKERTKGLSDNSIPVPASDLGKGRALRLAPQLLYSLGEGSFHGAQRTLWEWK